jgi:hypothetical protein
MDYILTMNVKNNLKLWRKKLNYSSLMKNHI